MIHTVWEWIDAERAMELLAANTNNRRYDKREATKMARDMIAGRWTQTTDTVGIDVDGCMTNAQHRLGAVVIAAELGHPVRILMGITYGLPADSFDVTDQGRTRSVSQILARHGLKNTRDMSAAAGLVLRYRDGAWIGPAAYTKTELERFIMDDSERWGWLASSVLGKVRNGRIFNRASLLALAYLVDQESVSPEMWPDFFDALMSGESLSKGDPRLALRQWSERNHGGPGGAATQAPRMAAYIKAWNAHCREVPVTLIRWGASEKFPKVV